MGTPAFAADILASLLGWPEFSVQAVFTRPDREAGRGRRLMPSPVKVMSSVPLPCARPLIQTARLRNVGCGPWIPFTRPGAC